MLFHNKENQKNIQIRFMRDSVSMGDDCMAPHECDMQFRATDTLLDLLNAAAKYVPPMRDCKWEVICNAEVLGTLTSGIHTGYQVEIKRRTALISALPEREIFCRKIEKIKNLTYFERLEVLYGGVYFSLDCFSEYRNVSLILEKEETKITTRDKSFALAHGFKHRELGNYDKILPIDQFEGLRILRIPNNPHTKTVYIDISKDKVLDELKKRVKSPHCERYYCALDDADMSLAERIHVQAVSETVQQKVMNYCPVCGNKNDGSRFCTECGTKLLKD